MSTVSDRWFVRLAMVGVLVAALGLGACGRKAGLDLPPSASAQQTAPDTNAPPAVGPDGRPVAQGIGPDGRPVAPPGKKKRILLDSLLD